MTSSIDAVLAFRINGKREEYLVVRGGEEKWEYFYHVVEQVPRLVDEFEMRSRRKWPDINCGNFGMPDSIFWAKLSPRGRPIFKYGFSLEKREYRTLKASHVLGISGMLFAEYLLRRMGKAGVQVSKKRDSIKNKKRPNKLDTKMAIKVSALERNHGKTLMISLRRYDENNNGYWNDKQSMANDWKMKRTSPPRAPVRAVSCDDTPAFKKRKITRRRKVPKAGHLSPSHVLEPEEECLDTSHEGTVDSGNSHVDAYNDDDTSPNVAMVAAETNIIANDQSDENGGCKSRISLDTPHCRSDSSHEGSGGIVSTGSLGNGVTAGSSCQLDTHQDDSTKMDAYRQDEYHDYHGEPTIMLHGDAMSYPFPFGHTPLSSHRPIDELIEEIHPNGDQPIFEDSDLVAIGDAIPNVILPNTETFKERLGLLLANHRSVAQLADGYVGYRCRCGKYFPTELTFSSHIEQVRLEGAMDLMSKHLTHSDESAFLRMRLDLVYKCNANLRKKIYIALKNKQWDAEVDEKLPPPGPVWF